MAKERLDQLVVRHGLAESREQAQRLIRSGRVRVNGAVQSKPGHTFPDDAGVEADPTDQFVSRGGMKLEAAFKQFPLDVTGKVCADLGSSTGGFTDCLLQHGAIRVYAIDVGKGQLHWKLRNDDRVVVMEEVNARYLAPEQLPEVPTVAVADLSFISLTKVLPAAVSVLAPGGSLVTLIKPQFEAGREHVQRGGVVRDPAIHEQVIESVRTFGTGELGLTWHGHLESPLRGPAGNIEFVAFWEKAATGSSEIKQQ